MKNFIIIIFIAFNFTAESQSLWQKDYIHIGDIKANQFKIYNSFDNSIKIKFYKFNQYIEEYLIPPHGNINLKYPIPEFTKDIFNNYKVKIFYDDECYNYDLELLNQIAKSRYNNKKSQKGLLFFFRLLATGAENLSKEGSLTNQAGKVGNATLDFIEFLNDVEEDGFSSGSLNFLKSSIKNKVIDEVIDNKYLNTMTKSLDALYSYKSATIKIKTSDLDLAAYQAYQYISEEPYNTFYIDFEKQILPVIDPDSDGITNLYDKCPNSYGLLKYNGCSRKVFIARRRAYRRMNYHNLFIDLIFLSLNQEVLNKSNLYAKKMGQSNGASFNIAIPTFKRNLGKKSKGSIILDLGYRASDIYANFEPDKRLKLFDDNSFNIGISYGFLVNKFSKYGILLQPKVGTALINSIKTTSLESVSTGEPVPEDLFLIKEGKSVYYGFEMRIFKNSKVEYRKYIGTNSTNIIINPKYGILLGVKVVRNPKIILNPEYNFDTTIDNIEFEYVQNSLMYYGGMSIIF